MRLHNDEIATLDLTAAHEKALEAHEQLERLAKIAADPDAYTLPEFQAAMDTAKYIESYWGSGPVALEAEDVVASFVAQVEARRACRKYALVPLAKYDELRAQLEQAKAAQVSFTLDCRVAKPIDSDAPLAPIGPGDPEPPPPPPTKAVEPWTGQKLWGMLCESYPTQYAPWSSITVNTTEIVDRLAAILNGKLG